MIPGQLPPVLGLVGETSFQQVLATLAPDLLPVRLTAAAEHESGMAPHGTTIVALTWPGGVVMAGDRRATMGSMIAQRSIEKVYPADEHSSIGVAGSAGIAIELVRMFQVELEHFEKIEGFPLSLDGKANRLSAMLRGNLPLAMQGLAVVPMLAGFDVDRGMGRIFSYDVTGGRYEERDFYSVGSGSVFARGALKKLYSPDSDELTAIAHAIEALFDAADDDSATGGPDLARQIYPVVAAVDAEGFRYVRADQVAQISAVMIQARMTRPDGPRAMLGGPQA